MPDKARYVVDDNNMDDAKDPVPVQEAAAYLGRSTEQVRRYLREGALVGYRVGQQWFIPRRALEEKMDERVEGRREEMMALMERVNRRREGLGGVGGGELGGSIGEAEGASAVDALRCGRKRSGGLAPSRASERGRPAVLG